MYLLFSEAIFTAAFLIPLLIFFESKPKTPPAPVPKVSGPPISFTESICKMFKDVKFVRISN
jgi:FLVCR family feline leukemia virus subgroup C receptor-related protein